MSALRLVHVISGLGMGGAETFLLRLCRALPRSDVDARVICASPGGAMVAAFRAAGINVCELGVSGGGSWASVPGALGLLKALVREHDPHIVHGWMNHGNLFAWYARGRAAPRARLIWGIRQTVYDLRLEKCNTQLAIRLQALLSRRPDAIVCNSRIGCEQHAALGFARTHMSVVPNGFDLPEAVRDADADAHSDAAAPDVVRIGMIARNHPMKDYPSFLRAFAFAAGRDSRLRAYCVGQDVPSPALGLPQLVQELGIGDRCVLEPGRMDLSSLYRELDIVCLSSTHGEGFPNVIGEAMANGVPCIATAVGDAPEIIGDSGRIVPPHDPQRLGAAMLEIAALGASERAALGARARARIEAHYTMPAIAACYLRLYDELRTRNGAHV